MNASCRFFVHLIPFRIAFAEQIFYSYRINERKGDAHEQYT